MDGRGAALTTAAPPQPRTDLPGRGSEAVPARPHGTPPAWLLAVVPVGFLALFLVWPLANVLSRGLDVGALEVLTRRSTISIMWFTLWQAVVSTLLTLVAGLPIAYVLHRYRLPARRVLLALVTVPFVLPTVVVGTAFRAVLPQAWIGTVAAILIAHVFFNVAVVVRVVGGLLQHLDPRYDQAARSLGASPWHAFRTVTWPLVRPAVLAAAALVFCFTFTSFGVVLVLGGPRHPTLEVEIYRRTAQLLDLSGAAALALVQVLAVGLVLLVSARLQARLAVRQRSRPVRGGARPGPRTSRADAGRARARRDRAHRGADGRPRRPLAASAGRVGPGLVAHPARRPRHDARRRRRRLACGSRSPTPRPRSSSRWSSAGWPRARWPTPDAAAGRSNPGSCCPLGVSAVTVGFGMLLAFNRAPLDLRGSIALVPLGHALVAVPLVLAVTIPVLRSLDPRLREVSATLGASPWRTWRAVDGRALGRALAVGAGLAAAVSLGEFGATAFLARAGEPTLPVVVVRLLGRPGEANVGTSAAAATLLMIVTATVVLVADRWRTQQAGSL